MSTNIKEMFRTPISPPKTTITPSGEKEEEVIAMRLDEYGNEEFYIAGKTNVYEKIQADLEDSKIGVILRRVAENGDISVFNTRQGVYGDITNLPQNRIEAYNIKRKAEEKFNELPKEIRDKYNNNLEEYLKDFGSENWLTNMGYTKAESKTDPTPKEGGEN